MIIKIVLGSLIGGLLGFGYYYFVGCRTGTCAVWANPYASTIYGSVLGFLITNIYAV